MWENGSFGQLGRKAASLFIIITGKHASSVLAYHNLTLPQLHVQLSRHPWGLNHRPHRLSTGRRWIRVCWRRMTGWWLAAGPKWSLWLQMQKENEALYRLFFGVWAKTRFAKKIQKLDFSPKKLDFRKQKLVFSVNFSSIWPFLHENCSESQFSPKS